MKKIFATVLVLFLFASLTYGQGMKLGIGGQVGLPMGTFGDITSIGFGGVVQGEMEIGTDMIGTLTTGYLIFTGKSEDVGGATVEYPDWSAIPVLVGTKYYFAKAFYGTVQAGLNFVSFEQTIVNPFTGTSTTSSVSESKFGYGIGVGYELTPEFDVNVKYQTLASDAAFVGLTALYKFGL